MSGGAFGTAFAFLRVSTGAPWVAPWRGLFAGLSKPRAVDEDRANRWTLARFVDDRRLLANVLEVSGVVLDVDGGATRSELEAALADVWAVAHTTKRATVEAPRWRVVLPASRPMTPAEYARCWRAAAALLERANIAPDYAGNRANHVWCVPLVRPYFESFETTGAIFDVDAALLEIPEPTPIPLPVPTSLRSASAYVRAAVEREAHEVATAGSGVRNATLNRAAFALARFVSSGDLSLDDFEATLVAAGRAAGLPLRECMATLRSALRGRRVA